LQKIMNFLWWRQKEESSGWSCELHVLNHTAILRIIWQQNLLWNLVRNVPKLESSVVGYSKMWKLRNSFHLCNRVPKCKKKSFCAFSTNFQLSEDMKWVKTNLRLHHRGRISRNPQTNFLEFARCSAGM
jgi:hypothetical protein